MLIRFEVENFRSIHTPVQLSMVAIDRDRPGAREHAALGESLVTLAGIYGPNASGKSSVVQALAWLRAAVLFSLRGWEDSIPVEQFAFTDQTDRVTSFTLDLESNGIRYEYLLELTPDAVQYEALFEYPKKRSRRIFEREGNDLEVPRGATQLSAVRQLLTERTLTLSLMRRFDVDAVAPVTEAISRLQVHGVRAGFRQGPRDFRGYTYGVGARAAESVFNAGRAVAQPSLFGDDEEMFTSRRARAVSLLRLADLGVDDVVYIEETVTYEDGDSRTRRRPTLLHRAGNDRRPLEFSEESAGTQAWFHLIPSILHALERGSIVVFDELDASLHPTLSAELLRLFREPATNPHGAQLVFTSHDTSLLNELNRDEVWLTEKRPDGSTRLGALSNFAGERVRTSQNLARGYLGGRFGGLPDVDHTDFLRTLGLIG
ncbi:AAA family ATPase [Cellulosimicrobium sp. CpK407]|uniref:AAA family ATPase n=1 Tax=Cellulosimicrobium sp. CpK407 TaxID=3229847 RepID=UPI003F347C3C